MGDIVNLNQARKARDKAEKKRAAEVNRAAFGRTKADRTAGRIDAERNRKLLDGARRESDVASDD